MNKIKFANYIYTYKSLHIKLCHGHKECIKIIEKHHGSTICTNLFYHQQFHIIIQCD